MQAWEIVDAAVREVMLFAAAGLFVGGLDDLAVDACFAVRRLLGRGTGRIALGRLPLPADPLRCRWSLNWEDCSPWDRPGPSGMARAETAPFCR